MKQLLDTVAALEKVPASGERAVLATLMKVAGSAYSGPGATLLILPDASVAGNLGASCFEQDLIGHARRVRTSLEPALVRYDLTADDDKPWGLGMGCRGKLDLLLEPAPPGRVPEHLTFLVEAAYARQAAAVATVFRTGAPGPALGERAMVRADGHAAGVLLDGPLGGKVLSDARRVLAEERSRLCIHRLPSGAVELLVEHVPPPIALVICDGGRDAESLARFARELAWQVTVIGKDRLPAGLDDRTAAVIMSHNYEHDLALLMALVPSAAPYIGVLGSRKRTQELLAKLAKRGAKPTKAQLARVHAPVGLDIGGETPSEVALSIVAEIQAVFAGRRGGALRDRRGRIHDRP
ncbi:MAG: XdhC family protein [Gemmatimonadales bacterium]|jgi:xanthine/CO dehydrogenase XdhC/CoxF family maturation factor